MIKKEKDYLKEPQLSPVVLKIEINYKNYFYSKI